jgi:uncharacterized protein
MLRPFTGGCWLNPPMECETTAQALRVVTGEKTDFWRQTHYGFIRDNGHFLAFEAEGDFTASLKVQGRFEQLYDQAGLMLRLDDERWIKTGVEFTDGLCFLSSVVTHGVSDWSIARPFEIADRFMIRLTVSGGAVRIQASLDGAAWPMLRLCPFPQAARYQIGPMACSPQRRGLDVRFTGFSIGPALTTDLHDPS